METRGFDPHSQTVTQQNAHYNINTFKSCIKHSVYSGSVFSPDTFMWKTGLSARQWNVVLMSRHLLWHPPEHSVTLILSFSPPHRSPSCSLAFISLGHISVVFSLSYFTPSLDLFVEQGVGKKTKKDLYLCSI